MMGESALLLIISVVVWDRVGSSGKRRDDILSVNSGWINHDDCVGFFEKVALKFHRMKPRVFYLGLSKDITIL